MSKQTIYRFENYSLNPSRLQLLDGEESVRLEPQVIRLLALLVVNSDRVVTKDEINEEIWNGRVVSDASLASRLRAARSAIGDSGSEQRLIRTIPSVGIQFVGEVTVSEVTPDTPIRKLTGWTRARPLMGLSLFALALCLLMGAWYFVVELPKQTLHAQFERIPDAAIRFYNHKKYREVTVEDCMRRCLEMTEFTCRSFDYYKRLNVCDLSAATAESVGGLKTDYELDPYDHYARKAYPPGPIELGREDTLDPINPDEIYTDAGVE